MLPSNRYDDSRGFRKNGRKLRQMQAWLQLAGVGLLLLLSITAFAYRSSSVKLHRETQQLLSRISEAETEKSRMQSQLSTKDVSIGYKDQTLQRMRRDLEAVRDEAQREKDALKRQLDEATTTKTKLEDAYKELTDAHSAKAQDHTACDSQSQELKNKVYELAGALAECHADTSKMKREHEDEIKHRDTVMHEWWAERKHLLELIDICNANLVAKIADKKVDATPVQPLDPQELAQAHKWHSDEDREYQRLLKEEAWRREWEMPGPQVAPYPVDPNLMQGGAAQQGAAATDRRLQEQQQQVPQQGAGHDTYPGLEKPDAQPYDESSDPQVADIARRLEEQGIKDEHGNKHFAQTLHRYFEELRANGDRTGGGGGVAGHAAGLHNMMGRNSLDQKLGVARPHDGGAGAVDEAFIGRLEAEGIHDARGKGHFVETLNKYTNELLQRKLGDSKPA